jgi:DNA polymerase-3 subunit chi
VAQVEFHSGLADPLHYACRLLRKAWRQGAKVVVTAPASTLQALDRALWTFEAQEFVPHVRVRQDRPDHPARAFTPIWLCEGEAPMESPKVLLNLGDAQQPKPERFERIIELVADDAEARWGARQRWRDYETRGWSIEHHARGSAAS